MFNKIVSQQTRSAQGTSEIKVGTFLSKKNRFGETKQASVIGPGSYNQDYKEKHTYDYHVAPTKQPIVPAEHQWIIKNDRKPFDLSNSWNKLVGPGKYGEIMKQIQKQHSNWSKGDRFNRLKVSKGKEEVGPGSYFTSPQHNKKSSDGFGYMFKSQSPKSVMAQLFKEDKSKDLSINPEEKQVASASVADSYSKKSHESPVFKSRCLRFETQRQSHTDKVGPGEYRLEPEALTKKVIKVQSGIHYKSRIEKDRNQCSLPGVGQYSISKRVDSLPLGVIMRQERFKNSQKKLSVFYR